MKRRINLVGQNTLTVSLPSEFVKRQGLKKGQEIEIEEQGNDLLISTEKKIEVEKKVLNLKGLSGIERQFLDAVYKKGYDEIEIQLENTKQIEDIKEALKNELSTFEIINRDKDNCLIKSISELDEKEFDNILKRTFILLEEMFNEIEIAIEEKNDKKVRECTELEEINDKLTHLLRRSLNKKGYKDHKNVLILYSIIQNLEKIADYLRDFCNEFKKNYSILLLFIKLKEMFVLYHELFYNFDSSLIKKIKERKHSIRNMEKKFQRENFWLVYALTGCSDRISELVGLAVSLRV